MGSHSIRYRVVFVGIAALLLLLAGPAAAETVYMKNGTVLVGKVVTQSRTVVQLQTAGGPVVLSKDDILRIDYGQNVQQKPVEEDRRLQQQKAEEERRKAEELKKAEDLRRQEEERDRMQREKAEEALKRRGASITLYLAGGQRRTASELLWSEVQRRTSSKGQFASGLPWRPSTWGPTLEGAAVRNAWRFDGGILYRRFHADSAWNTIRDDSLAVIGASPNSTPSWVPEGWSGSGSVAEVKAGLEREFLRSERNGLGIRLGALGSREQARIHDTVVAMKPSGGALSISEVRVPGEIVMGSQTTTGQLDIRWYRYGLRGGQALFSLGWEQGRMHSRATSTAVQWNSNNTPGGQDWNVRSRSDVKGPVFRADYSHALAGQWQYVVSLQARRWSFTAIDEGGLVTIIDSKGGGGMPLTIFNMLPSVLPSHSVVATVVELSFGIRRDLQM